MRVHGLPTSDNPTKVVSSAEAFNIRQSRVKLMYFNTQTPKFHVYILHYMACQTQVRLQCISHRVYY